MNMKNRNKAGITLIETLVSMLVLVVLVIGGSATLSHSGSMVVRQESQRAALAAATTLMEEYIQGIGLAGLTDDMTTYKGYTAKRTIVTDDGFAYVRVHVSGGTAQVVPFTLCYRMFD